MLGAKHNTEVVAERALVNGLRFQTETLPKNPTALFRLRQIPASIARPPRLNLANLGHLFRQAGGCHFVAGHAQDRARGAHRDGKPRIGVQDRRLHPIEPGPRQEPAPARERALPVAASRGGFCGRPSQKVSGRNTRFPPWAVRHPIIGRTRLLLTRLKTVLGPLDHASLPRRAANERVDHRPSHRRVFQHALRGGIGFTSLEDLAQQLIRRHVANIHPCMKSVGCKVIKAQPRMPAAAPHWRLV